MTHVYVGMSGGVDSSVTAALLQEQGYRVTGVYMKNWTQDLPGMICPWADDLADAKRVAVQLGIDFKVFDFQKEYKQAVVDYMIAEYQAGRTPNPDIMCNQEIKFKLFLQTALADGAQMIATGHYARVLHGEDRPAPLASNPDPAKPQKMVRPVSPYGSEKSGLDAAGHGSADAILQTARDTAKDQTYFLYRVTEEALQKTLFPLGTMTKDKVREHAVRLGLVTAAKPDSQGICFVGEVGIKEFLSQYVQGEPGDIIDKKTGNVIGQHDGAIFYTIGQRHGLGVGGGLPYYVVGKDMKQNIVYVTTDLNDENLWQSELHLNQLHWINAAPEKGKKYQVRTRYRAALSECMVQEISADSVVLALTDAQRAVTAGQSAVLYDGERVVGGGIIA